VDGDGGWGGVTTEMRRREKDVWLQRPSGRVDNETGIRASGRGAGRGLGAFSTYSIFRIRHDAEARIGLDAEVARVVGERVVARDPDLAVNRWNRARHRHAEEFV